MSKKSLTYFSIPRLWKQANHIFERLLKNIIKIECKGISFIYILIHSGKWCLSIGETRDLFKKIRDTNGTFHAKMRPVKDRNGMDLTEAEE